MRCMNLMRLPNCRSFRTAAAAAALTAPVFAFEPPPERTVTIVRAGSGSFLGIGVAEIEAERAKSLGLRDVHGVEVTRVEEDSPAAKGGMRTGDVVVEFNGQRVEGSEQFIRLVRETPPGRDVKLTVARGGATQSLVVRTGARKTLAARTGETFEIPNIVLPDVRMPDVPKAYMSWRSSILGIEAESLDSQLAGYFGVKEGVLVRAVTKATPADKAGIRAGDVILQVEDTKVATPREISSAIRSARSKKTVAIQLMRERRELTLNLALEDDSVPFAAPRRPSR